MPYAIPREGDHDRSDARPTGDDPLALLPGQRIPGLSYPVECLKLSHVRWGTMFAAVVGSTIHCCINHFVSI